MNLFTLFLYRRGFTENIKRCQKGNFVVFVKPPFTLKQLWNSFLFIQKHTIPRILCIRVGANVHIFLPLQKLHQLLFFNQKVSLWDNVHKTKFPQKTCEFFIRAKKDVFSRLFDRRLFRHCLSCSVLLDWFLF